MGDGLWSHINQPPRSAQSELSWRSWKCGWLWERGSLLALMLSVCSVPAETDEHSDRLWMVCLKSSLNTSRKTSSSCPRFNLASDCTRSPVPTSWFLPHAGLHLATEHSQSQELERGTHCRLVSPPHHLCPHSGDSWRHFFSSDNSVNNTNYCVVVLKCLALSTTLILANWTELNWTLPMGGNLTSTSHLGQLSLNRLEGRGSVTGCGREVVCWPWC